MPRQTNRALEKSRLQSWVNGIPLGSLEQLQNAGLGNGPTDEPPGGATIAPLPDSEPTSISHSHVVETASNHTLAPSLAPVFTSNHDLGLRRSSAESLWQLPTPKLPAESRIPLPDSMIDSDEQARLADTRSDSEAATGAASQEAAVRRKAKKANATGQANPMSTGKDQAIATISGTSLEIHRVAPNQYVSQVRRLNYWQRTASLMDCLPHLKAIHPENGRHRNIGFVTCIDYLRGHDQPIVYDKLAINQFRSRRAFTDRLGELRNTPETHMATRVILVEDLSPGLIESLGTVFEIDPEVFAEHLNRSGYDGVDYDDELPTHWETHSMPKAHASMKWYRPVHENPRITQWMEDPSKLLDRVSSGEKKDNRDVDLSEPSERADIQRSPKVVQWIKRPSRLLTRYRRSTSEIDLNNAAEPSERLKRVPGSIIWSDPCSKPNGKPDKRAVRHQAVIGTNIFRRSWSLSTRPVNSKEVSEARSRWTFRPRARKGIRALTRPAHVVRKSSEDAWETDATPTAWEEKATFFHYRKSPVPIIFLLLDPLPAVTEFRRLLVPPKIGSETDSVSSSVPVQPDDKLMDMGLPVVARAARKFPPNKFDATMRDIEQLKRDTSTLISTADAVHIQQDTDIPSWLVFKANPVLALLRVVQTDTKAFFQCLERALDEISRDSLDDYLMSKRLEDWRRLMSDFEIEVPAIGKSLDEFVSFIFDDGKGSEPPSGIQLIIEGVEFDIARVNRRLIEAYAALRADMQFTESRRSINEAKTVTKLTELAFIFIPLSFTCSLFSMQITELSGGVPVWTFVVTALTMAVLAYGVRLILASDFIADSSRSALERFWSRRGVRRGDSAPIFTLVLLTVQEVWQKVGAESSTKAFLALFMSSSIVVPVAFMWTSTKMDIGFKLAVTFCLVLSGLALGLGLFLDTSIRGEGVTGWRGDESGVTSDEDV